MKDMHLTTHKGDRRDLKQLTAETYSGSICSIASGIALLILMHITYVKLIKGNKNVEHFEILAFGSGLMGFIFVAGGLVVFIKHWLFLYFLGQ